MKEKKPARFAVGDLVRDESSSNANTIYRVLYVREDKKHPWLEWQITIKPVFGLFKQDYKRNKNIGTGTGFVKVTKNDLCEAMWRLDEETSRESSA